MNSDKLSVEEMVEYYKPDVESLLPYLTWLETQKGSRPDTIYKGDGIEEHSMTFPVYDGTLLRFIKIAQGSSLINRNYTYTYSRNRIRTTQDELRFIQNATIKEMGELWGILSRYVLKGMTKAALWSEGVKNGVFLALLLKMEEILQFWDKQKKDTL